MPCCAWNCREDHTAIVDHPDHGRRAVCDEHAEDYPVLEVVGS